METKEKNKRLLIVVGMLLLVVGVSLAYFVSNILLNGNGASTKVTTAVINGATINIEGVISFEDLDILPGHKSVSAIKLTATGNNELIPYNLIWRGTNTLTTPLNYTIYKTSEELSVTSTCEKKKKAVGSMTQLSEECVISNIDKLGSEVASGIINKNDSKVILAKDEFVTASPTGQISYYYVILEYPNLNVAQNEDLNGSLEGEVTVEESNIKPDINIIAAYVEQDNGEYKEVEDIPSEGYAVNSKKSTCSNGARPIGVSPKITINNLSKSGTSCYIYLDKVTKEVNTTLGTLTVKTYEPDFSVGAFTDEGIYAVEDGMYGGTSYYWRGAATTNYLKFGGYCWRIVRINGDGTIRLIYDGTTCHKNGTNTTDSIVVANVAYNIKYDRSEYVGYTYVEGKQRPAAGDTLIDSNVKTKTEEWYNTNLASYSDKIADGKYCNGRDVQSGQSWVSVPISTLYYVGYRKIYIDYVPSLACDFGDTYSLKVGLITADEIMYAGGKGDNNIVYYLFNGQPYWTMSPTAWDADHSWVNMFAVNENGYLDGGRNVAWPNSGIRPVINLKSDITISSGNGTVDNPYIVAN